MYRILLALCACSCVVGTTADIIVTRDGRRIEGRVVERRGTQVVIQVERATLRAELLVEEGEIVSIERQHQTSYEALLERFAREEAIAAKLDNADAWEVLARWCKEQGLEDRMQGAIQRSLDHRVRAAEVARRAEAWSAIGEWCARWGRPDDAQKYHLRALVDDPDHAPSREALGHKRLDGVWLEPAAWREAHAEKMRLAGYVEVDGQWHTALAAQAIGTLRAQALARDVEALRGSVERIAQASARQAEEQAARLAELSAVLQQQAAEIARLHALLAESVREREQLASALRHARCRCGDHK